MLKRKACLGIALALVGVSLIAFNVNRSTAASDDLELSDEARKSVDVDHQRVRFPHKDHQDMVMKLTGNDPEMACKLCHHTKKTGKDPRACRRCHAKRQVKATGANLCVTGCHTKRPELDEKLKDMPGKGARKGQLLKLKDAFHLACKNCHAILRSANIELESTKYLAPILNCEGCHVAKNPEDEKAILAAKAEERKKAGDTFSVAIKAIAGKK